MTAEADALRFLHENDTADWTVIYASFSHVYLHAVLAPLERLRSDRDLADLLESFPQPDDRWRINWRYNMSRKDDVHISLEEPLADFPLLRAGEKLVIQRRWSGDGDAPARTEISQKLVHCLDIYHVEERDAYCRLDERGDFEEVIRVVHTQTDRAWTDTVVAVRRHELHEYATLADMALVTHFDFNRFRTGQHWTDIQRFDKSPDQRLFYQGGTEEGVGSYVIGRHIVFPVTNRDDVAQRMVAQDEGRGEHAYATFKVLEHRTGALVEASCDPRTLSNYFQPAAQAAHELSTAFFDAEVLSRYKTDTDKYTFTDHGAIHCRDSWGLRSYYINDVGQVHAYLVDLNKLPHHEQVYWSSFNEWPKGALSQTAIHNDFRGEFSPERDPLHSLKLRVGDLDAKPPAWWSPRGERLHRVVHLPATDSIDEWAEAILSLDHLVVEGFVQKALRRQLEKLGREFDPDWRSLKLAHACLLGNGLSADDADAAVAALKQTHDLRSVVKGHATVRKRTAAAKAARNNHGSLRSHFELLVDQCDHALAAIRTGLAD